MARTASPRGALWQRPQRGGGGHLAPRLARERPCLETTWPQPHWAQPPTGRGGAVPGVWKLTYADRASPAPGARRRIARLAAVGGGGRGARRSARSHPEPSASVVSPCRQGVAISAWIVLRTAQFLCLYWTFLLPEMLKSAPASRPRCQSPCSAARRPRTEGTGAASSSCRAPRTPSSRAARGRRPHGTPTPIRPCGGSP